MEFSLSGPKGLIDDKEEPPSFTTLKQEWKWYHDKLKHPPKARMLWMAKQGMAGNKTAQRKGRAFLTVT
jgi:hypothetical protein